MDSDKITAVQAVVDRVSSWQDGATEGTVDAELRKGLDEAGVSLSDDEVGKLSLVGAGMKSNPGVTFTFFEALAAANINIDMISTSEVRISVVTAADRLDEVAQRGLHETMADCHDPVGMYDAYAASAARLEAWHEGGRKGDRPPGRLRPIPLPPLSRLTRMWAKLPLDLVHDPDGRPGPIRGASEY